MPDTLTIAKVDDVEDPAERLFRLLEGEDQRIQRVFLTAVRTLKDELDLEELADLIAEGRTADAFARLAYAGQATANASAAAFIASGHSTAEFLSDAGLGRIVFDQVNVNAVAAMQRNRLRLVEEFTNEQRKATQTALLQGIENGTNPRAAARNFRDSIGLTTRQWGHVASYRRALESIGEPGAASDALSRELRDARSDRSIRRAVARNTPLTAEQIDSMVERYTNNYIRHRSEVIGRTEALRAVHEGNEESYRQAVENGVIREDQLEREWRTSQDGRERTSHALLNGQKKKPGEVWETVNGTLRFPGDPQAPAAETIQCRCAILTRIKRN